VQREARLAVFTYATVLVRLIRACTLKEVCDFHRYFPEKSSVAAR
jgi:hypothetical protein